MDKVEINGKEVVSFLPEYESPQALVSLAILKKLVKTATTQTSLNEIKEELCWAVNTAKNIESLTKILEKEVAFHKAVNMIGDYKEEEEEMPKSKGHHEDVF
jgi:hypothetical protein